MHLKNRIFRTFTNWKTIALFLGISIIMIYLISPIFQSKIGGGALGIPFIYYTYWVSAPSTPGTFYPLFLVLNLMIYYAFAVMLAILLNFGKKQD